MSVVAVTALIALINCCRLTTPGWKVISRCQHLKLLLSLLLLIIVVIAVRARDCDAAALKKAYRAKAVKLHPDKKGGDKAKFQQLNDMYNDILKVKLEESVVSEEIEAEWNADKDTIDRSQALMSKLEGYVLDIKTATTACTHLAQASLRWKKKVDKAGQQPCPKGVKRLIKLMKATGKEKDKDNKDKDKDGMTLKDSSCLLAEEHLQIIGVTVQLMVSELMALLSLGRYGEATGKNLHLMKHIEHLAMCGLAAQKCIPSLTPIETQIDSLLPRAELSYELAQTDAGVHDVLVQMFRTSFHTRHMTVGMAADSCVTVALAAAEICLAVKQIQLCDRDFKTELKRHAKQREQEDDMCEEDRAFMAAMAREQQQACREQAKEKEAEKEQAEERHREEGTEMEYLRGQVHSLQVRPCGDPTRPLYPLCLPLLSVNTTQHNTTQHASIYLPDVCPQSLIYTHMINI